MPALALSRVGRVRSWGASENEENREFAKADQIAHVMERGSYPFVHRPDPDVLGLAVEAVSEECQIVEDDMRKTIDCCTPRASGQDRWTGWTPRLTGGSQRFPRSGFP